MWGKAAISRWSVGASSVLWILYVALHCVANQGNLGAYLRRAGSEPFSLVCCCLVAGDEVDVAGGLEFLRADCECSASRSRRSRTAWVGDVSVREQSI